MNSKENKILPHLEHQFTFGNKTQNQKNPDNIITNSTNDETDNKYETIPLIDKISESIPNKDVLFLFTNII